jgi:sugar-specific transcriptional regulator TrmB
MSHDNKSLVSVLLGIGLSEAEATTYLALQDMDGASIRKVAAATGINRGTAYEALKRLNSLGLASVRNYNNRERYMAESPEKLLDIIRDKRRDLLEVATTAKAAIPKLLARQVSSDGPPLVRYYEGDDGIVTILKDVLQTCRNLDKREYYVYSSSSVRHYLYRKFPNFTKRRVDEGIRVRVIAVGEGGEIAEQAERKWIANPTSNVTSSYTIIYGNKIATIAITRDGTPYGVIIEDAGAASMQRILFDQLWQHL